MRRIRQGRARRDTERNITRRSAMPWAFTLLFCNSIIFLGNDSQTRLKALHCMSVFRGLHSLMMQKNEWWLCRHSVLAGWLIILLSRLDGSGMELDLTDRYIIESDSGYWGLLWLLVCWKGTLDNIDDFYSILTLGFRNNSGIIIMNRIKKFADRTMKILKGMETDRWGYSQGWNEVAKSRRVINFLYR